MLPTEVLRQRSQPPSQGFHRQIWQGKGEDPRTTSFPGLLSSNLAGKRGRP